MCGVAIICKQTQYCIESWSRDSSSSKVSTALVAETSQILLIYDLLKSMDVNEYLKSIENVVIDDTIDMRIFPGLESEQKRGFC